MYFAGCFLLLMYNFNVILTTGISSIIFTLCFSFQARFVLCFLLRLSYLSIFVPIYQKAFSFYCRMTEEHVLLEAKAMGSQEKKTDLQTETVKSNLTVDLELILAGF